MTLSFVTQGKITFGLYVNLVDSDWGLEILMHLNSPGIRFYRASNGLQVMDHMRDVNTPTELGQHLADLLNSINQIEYIHFNPTGNFIQIEFQIEYSESNKIAEVIENTKRIIQAFDDELKSTMVART